MENHLYIEYYNVEGEEDDERYDEWLWDMLSEGSDTSSGYEEEYKENKTQ